MEDRTGVLAARPPLLSTLRFLAVLMLLTSWIFPRVAVSAEDDSGVSEELRQRCVRSLQDVLSEGRRWVKVHAAEYLLALEYREGVQAAFQGELEQFSEEPQYRIGIWRVLARAADNDKQRNAWTGKIRKVFLDPAATDRLHAVETLAKLGYQVCDDDVGAFEEAARPDRTAMTAFARWVLVNSDRPEAEARLAELLASPDVKVRGYAAYALRHLHKVSPQVAEQLATAVEREPAGSLTRVFVVGAAAVHNSGKGRAQLIDELVREVARGSGDQCAQAVQTLAQVGTKAELPLLVGLLESSDPDQRAAAAAAILRIGRRAPHHLVALDWAVIALYALGMLSVGWYYSRRTKTREDYLLGGRRMRPWSVGVSLFASLISTISYLAWPGEMIKNGPMMLGAILAYPLIAWVVGWFMIPFIMRLKVTSAYEILELRLGSGVRTLGSLLFLSLRLLWMSVIIYATTSKVLVPLLGLDPMATPLVCVTLGAITVMYTAMGGLRAVVLTDVIQSAILFGSAIITVVVATIAVGGVDAWWPSQWAPHWQEPVYGYDPNARVTLFGAALAMFTWYVCTSGSDQIAIQRYLATRDAKAARTVLSISLVADALVQLILAGVGFALLAYFRARPQLLGDGQTIISDADKLFPQFIVVGLPVGLSGLVVAGLLAAAMSALSAGVNSTCSVITVDFLDRFGKRRSAATEASGVRRVKVVSVMVGALVVCLSLFVNMVHGNLLEICYKVVNLLTAPLFGLFFMAMFVRWATGFGTLVGAACGVATAIAICYWKEFTGTQGISFLWALPGSFLVEVGVGSLVSLLPIGARAKPLEEIA